MDPFGLSAGQASGGADCFACTVPSVTVPGQELLDVPQEGTVPIYKLSFVGWWNIGQGINLTLSPHSPSSGFSLLPLPFIPPAAQSQPSQLPFAALPCLSIPRGLDDNH